VARKFHVAAGGVGSYHLKDRTAGTARPPAGGGGQTPGGPGSCEDHERCCGNRSSGEAGAGPTAEPWSGGWPMRSAAGRRLG